MKRMQETAAAVFMDIASGWSIIEWESMGGSDYSNSGALLNVSQWKGKKVTAAVNGGRYKGL